jgi:hypothetical protein
MPLLGYRVTAGDTTALRVVLRLSGAASAFSAEGMTLFSQYAGSRLDRSAFGGALAALVRKYILWRPVRGRY